jgi:hypothetical protein
LHRCWNSVAPERARARNLAAAESEFRTALAVYDKSLPATEALAMSEQSVNIWNATSPALSPYTAQAHAIHANALAHVGKPRESAEELDAALPVLLKARGADDPVVRRAQNWLKAVRPAPLQTASTAP